jgi:CubicO group peptidase (beta-lactamase class C family)
MKRVFHHDDAVVSGGSMTREFTFDEIKTHHAEFTLENWDEYGEIMRYTFLRMGEFFPSAVISRDGPVAMLADAPDDRIAGLPVRTPLGTLAFDDYVQQGPVNGVIVVRGGAVVYERYPRMLPSDRHLLMSVSKVFASTLVAMLEDRGLVDSQAPVETYLPRLRASGWEGVSVLDVLDMASGIDCDQTLPGVYTDPTLTYYRYEESLGWLPPAHQPISTWEYLAELGRAEQPGTAFVYSSANTSVLSWLVEEVTGKGLADVIAEELWGKIGAEGDALITISRDGVMAIHGGISARLRDVARFGLLFTPSWRTVSESPLISEQYLHEIQHGGRPEIFDKGQTGKNAIERLSPARPVHNSYQWDFVMPDGDFFKGGYGGQGLYISPARDLVIAFVGTPRDPGEDNAMVSVAQQICATC